MSRSRDSKLANPVSRSSVPDGPNRPLIPEIHGNNPDAVYIPRTGQITRGTIRSGSSDREERAQDLIIAGMLTSVCMAFPTFSSVAAGYKVFNVVDASGDWSSMATAITLARVVQAGARPIDTLAVLAETMGTWNRADAMEYAAIMTSLMPNYQLLMESYDKAQRVQREGHETKLEAAQAKK